MPGTRDVEPVVQVPLDTDPDDLLLTVDELDSWPADPDVEGTEGLED